MKKILAAILGLMLVSASAFAQKVSVVKDEKGWRIMDRGQNVEIKGVVWAFTPIGETHTFSLFDQSDEYIKAMIDTDMPMLKAMGVNTIRCFTMIPPKWVEYIYSKYGIYSIINDTLGRYGISVNGTWYGVTDYSDYYTRETLIAQAKRTAETYKDTKGVLMYLFGNESNYGLVWSSNEIENLPTGEQDNVKAGYLYDLLEKAMAACKEIDPYRPVGIVNGDTQYLSLIKELCPSLDILGVNAYRGYRFYDSFYENVAEILDKPIVFTEAGADAFNDILMQEDQTAQMTYLESQWQEIYEQAYGKGKCQNVVGGFVFEWIDEWWKRYQNKNLDQHDGASWSNSGYDIDYADGVNNMSEEWFGICAQSTLKKNGIHVRIPRASYYMLQDVWKLSLYDSSKEAVAVKFGTLKDSLYIAKGNEKSIKQTLSERDVVKISQANVSVVATTPVSVELLKSNIKNKKNIKNSFRFKDSDGKISEPTVAAEGTLGVEVKPTENLTGEIVFKAWNNEPMHKLDDHWASYYEKTNTYGTNSTDKDHLKYVDLYSATFNYNANMFDLNGYYHEGHASFEGKGDPFSISKEAFDIIGYDTYGSKAPIALEFVGKNVLDGLQIIGGPEIWGSAKPQIQANYWKWIPLPNIFLDGVVVNATYAEEFGSSNNVKLDPYNGFGAGRKASIYAETFIYPWVTLKAGVLHSGGEKVGAKYLNDKGKQAKITFADTIGGYAQLGTEMFQHMYIYANGIYRGLVAETNAAMVRGSFFTGDSGSGNRIEVQGGVNVAYGNFEFKPVIRARKPLQNAAGRKLTSGSPFIVDLGNRQCVEIEAVLTYDPEGATWFHEWNSNDIEGAPIAASITGLYQLFAGKTDSIPYRSSDKDTIKRNDGTTVTDFVWYEGGALPLQKNLWQVGGRLVTNPIPDLRIIFDAYTGRMGATTGAYLDAGTKEFVQFVRGDLAVRYNKWMLKSSVSYNDWGDESWWRNFNMTFPWQYSVDVAYGFDKPKFENSSNRVGIKVVGAKFGKDSSDAYFALPKALKNIKGANYLEASVYCNFGL
ncbi:MAG: hypothetical protein MR420_01290 [Spirochaetia bacterium]|nr:hypothetical protein [Spirochaetia bacterium]